VLSRAFASAGPAPGEKARSGTTVVRVERAWPCRRNAYDRGRLPGQVEVARELMKGIDPASFLAASRGGAYSGRSRMTRPLRTGSSTSTSRTTRGTYRARRPLRWRGPVRSGRLSEAEISSASSPRRGARPARTRGALVARPLAARARPMPGAAVLQTAKGISTGAASRATLRDGRGRVRASKPRRRGGAEVNPPPRGTCRTRRASRNAVSRRYPIGVLWQVAAACPDYFSASTAPSACWRGARPRPSRVVGLLEAAPVEIPLAVWKYWSAPRHRRARAARGRAQEPLAYERVALHAGRDAEEIFRLAIIS